MLLSMILARGQREMFPRRTTVLRKIRGVIERTAGKALSCRQSRVTASREKLVIARSGAVQLWRQLFCGDPISITARPHDFGQADPPEKHGGVS
jgi:hypothetical protein